jgi:parvulin-like peptidyl-prolyl isomerase
MINFKGTMIQYDEIITSLKKNIQLKEACQEILRQKIIEQAAQERGISITAEEVQTEADKLRYEHSLVKASDTLAWLTDQLITPDEWEAGIRDRLLSKKLSELLFAKEVAKFFVEKQLDFDQVLLYRIIVPYAQLAQEISYQIQEGEISFYQAAHLYDIDERRRYHCGCEGKVYRWNLKPDIAAIVFSARIGDVIGPFTIDQTSHLLMVEEFIPAELTKVRYQEILNKIFKEWLDAELNYMLHS